MKIQISITQRVEFLKANRKGFIPLDVLETIPQLKEAIQAYRSTEKWSMEDIGEEIKKVMEYGEKNKLVYDPERARALFGRV